MPTDTGIGSVDRQERKLEVPEYARDIGRVDHIDVRVRRCLVDGGSAIHASGACADGECADHGRAMADERWVLCVVKRCIYGYISLMCVLGHGFGRVE